MGTAACAGRCLTLDVFASDTNTRVAGCFYSKWMCPGTSRGGQRQLCWINGPFSQLGRILKKIREEKCDAVLIHPKSSAYWMGMLKHLPVRERLLVPTWQCKRGHRLPENTPDLRHAKLTAAIIIWCASNSCLYSCDRLQMLGCSATCHQYKAALRQ